MGGRSIRGNSVAEAVSLGTLAIMNRDEVIHHELIIDECNVKTLTMNRSKEEIGFALGKICGVMTTEDKGFADKLEQLIENESGGELYDKI